MKQLLISIAALGLVLSAFIIFDVYADSQLDSISRTCEKDIVSMIDEKAWDDALTTSKKQFEKWSDFKRYSAFFNDANEVNEIDSCFRKTIMYIKAQDDSNSSGELVSLASKIEYLNKKENVSLKNIL